MYIYLSKSNISISPNQIYLYLQIKSPAGLLLVFEGFLGVSGGSSCVLNGVVHVGVNSGFKAIIGEVMTQTDKAELMDLPVDNLPLLFNQHGHVHEHLVEFLDRRLQLHEHLMSEEK